MEEVKKLTFDNTESENTEIKKLTKQVSKLAKSLLLLERKIEIIEKSLRR